MITKDDVKKLADLSRISLTDDELDKLSIDIKSIVEYIDVIQKIEIPDDVAPSPHFDVVNAMREDGEPHETGLHTEDIVAQFPNKKDNYLKVKKILS